MAKRGGWFRHPKEHALAAKGVHTSQTLAREFHNGYHDTRKDEFKKKTVAKWEKLKAKMTSEEFESRLQGELQEVNNEIESIDIKDSKHQSQLTRHMWELVGEREALEEMMWNA